MSGYDISRFQPQPQQHLMCLVCNKVVKDPLECNFCGQMYCNDCVATKPPCKSKDCCYPPNSSENIPQYVKIQGAMLKVYKNLQLYCLNPECKKLCSIIDIEQHQNQCIRVKCLNHDNCKEYLSTEENKQTSFCSLLCELTVQLFENASDHKKQYEIIKKFQPKLSGSQSGSINLSNNKSIQIIQIQPSMNIEGGLNFKWDKNKCGSGILLTSGDTCVFLKESSYIFRTVLGDQGFENGVHYWEIEADSRTENELKIGVCQGNNINLNAAFCDLNQGFAYYGLAQLRNGSNASGQTYGKRFKKEGVLGVCLNMINGTLSFSLNGEFMGIAFRSELLKKGPIYAAVALLHCAGCTLKTGKPKPSYME
ncbi:unnamed protein product [Paramecium primaurelia]|uniref:B30.2/SPRY domain-containing protein n=1 Tax=Paramecium primaurelia TaxID=5886 RepID=A0A8S1MVH7_PARPR|nr:unnamed protein product [Paramecium primaurelia]